MVLPLLWGGFSDALSVRDVMSWNIVVLMGGGGFLQQEEKTQESTRGRAERPQPPKVQNKASTLYLDCKINQSPLAAFYIQTVQLL